jgi:hypothetical protein
MSEKNYVINIKTKAGTIFTVRADSAAELNTNVQDVVNNATNQYVVALEQLLTDNVAPATPEAVIQAAFPNSTVVTTPAPTSAPAPVITSTPANIPVSTPEPVAQTTGAPVCRHGAMSWVAPANKPWKGWFCPQPKDATDKCSPQFVKG